MKSFSEDEEVYRAIQIEVLTVSPDIITSEEESKRGRLTEIPLLSFELENGENFLMANIPVSIAIEIASRLNNLESNDSRLTIAELIPEVLIVEKVVIDSVVPYSTTYQATVTIRLEGFSEIQHFQMVPSHATLLAIIADTPIYVSKSVLSSTPAVRK